MALLSLQDVSVSFGRPPLLEKVNMQVEKGERVCLLGRNGEGKTTLLRLISGKMEPDSGVITLRKGTRVAGLSQELPTGLTGSVHEVVAGGLAVVGSLLEEYHQLTSRLAHGADEAMLRRIGLLQESVIESGVADRMTDEFPFAPLQPQEDMDVAGAFGRKSHRLHYPRTRAIPPGHADVEALAYHKLG